MAKLFITGFQSISQANINCYAFFDYQGEYAQLNLDGINYDPASSTSVRQQIIDRVVDTANMKLTSIGLTAYTPLIASDVEFVC